jgi:hypothetical protein
MIIKVDQDGNNAIVKLCDVALKTGGIQNLEAINIILKSLEEIKEETKDE